MNNILSDNLGNLVKAGGGKIHTGPFGSQLHAADYVQEGIPCIMPANMKSNRVDLSDIAYITEGDANRLSKYIVKKDDIVYSRRGDVTLKALIREKEDGYFCGTGCLLLRPGDKFDSRFLTHYLSTPTIQNWIVRQAVGATMPNLNTGILASIPFNGPKKEEQEKIADVLSVIEDKIELNNRINSELEAMAKTLYDYWFVQFDFPDANGKPYKASGGKMVYNYTLKRKIPEGWEVRPFSEHLTCNAKKLGKKHGYSEIQYLDTANLTKNVVDTLQPLVVSVDKIPSRANMIVSKNDILYSTVRPNQLHYGIITQPVENMVASTGYSVLSHKSDSSINVLFYLHLTNEANTQRLIKISESSKSSYPSISPDDILSIDIALPKDGGAVDKAVGMLNPLFKKISETQRENKELASLRDWLLPMLMNGQVTVKPSTESQETLHG
ncbi:restriction endonuclease subunit S [Shewanella chilikensis]|uniref:restriction endonuclease subunit S n=1 Tax=Shewanella chilikensis TaxID=558541 RepID=UPI00197DB509|nr:restriction endonuclease subunit S [Shewanella chilikensis]